MIKSSAPQDETAHPVIENSDLLIRVLEVLHLPEVTSATTDLAYEVLHEVVQYLQSAQILQEDPSRATPAGRLKWFHCASDKALWVYTLVPARKA